MLTLFFLFLTSSYASVNPYFLNDDINTNSKATQKILEIGNELKNKTGVNAYIYAKQDFNLSENILMDKKINVIKSIENNITKNLTGSYVVLVLSVDDVHVNLLISNDLKNIVDKDEILDDYVIPLLASKDKNSLDSKISAAILNGYAEITDRIAASKGVTLSSSIGSGGTQASSIWKVFMYTLLLGGIVAYTIAILRSKKNG